METRQFILEFIEVYRSLPALWNVKEKEYSNKDIKNKQYEILLKKFREKYPEATKKEVAAKVNTLRTNYRRVLRTRSGLEKDASSFSDENEKALYYFDALDFLRDSLSEKTPKVTTPKKRKSVDPSGELIALAAKRLSRPSDEFRSIADSWASKLRKLEYGQRMLAEKFINDILFEAHMGALHRNWLCPNTDSRASSPLTNPKYFKNTEAQVSSFDQMSTPAAENIKYILSIDPLSPEDNSSSSV